MDEFVSYQLIACKHYEEHGSLEFNSVSKCQEKYVDIFNTGLLFPTNEFKYYVGTFSSFYYYPLFLVWKSPNSARFLGLVFLLIGALILSITFRRSLVLVFSGLLLFFPYFFQHLVDTGPIKYQILSVFLIYYLMVRWFKSFKIVYPIIISLLVFLGIWNRLNYLWYGPALFLIFLMFVIENWDKVLSEKRKFLIQCLVSFAVLCFLFSILFLSSVPGTDKYPYVDRVLYHSGKGFQTHRLAETFLDPLRATERIYSYNSPSLFSYIYSGFLYLSIPLLWLIFLMGVEKKVFRSVRKNLFKSIVLYFSFILTVIFTFLTPMARHYHHSILSFPFLILSFFLILSCFQGAKMNFISTRKVIVCWLVIFILLNAYLFVKFPTQSEYPGWRKALAVDDVVPQVLADEHLAKNYIYFVGEWGFSFTQALYGNKLQMVGSFNQLTEAKITKLNKLSELYNRKLLFIFRGDAPKPLKEQLGAEPCILTEQQNGSYWKIALQPDNQTNNICFS